jgi:hypothetical protein
MLGHGYAMDLNAEDHCEGRWCFIVMRADGPVIRKYRPVFAVLAAHVALLYRLTLLILREGRPKWKKHQVPRCNSKYGQDATQGSILRQSVSAEEGSRNAINVTAILCHVHAEDGDSSVR